MKMRFTCSGHRIENVYDQELQTTTSSSCLSSKKLYSGSWYGEVTHVNGNNSHYFGIRTACGSILFYPEGNIQNPRIYTDGCFSTDPNESIQRNYLPFSLTNDHTVGVHYNSVLNIFSVVYNNTIYPHNCPPESKQFPFQFRYGGGTINNTNDIIKLNFGIKEFKYNIPSLAFVNNTCQTCKNSKHHPINSFLLLFFCLRNKHN